MKARKIRPLGFEWDEGNKEKNWKKHQVYFRECEELFTDENLKTLYDIKHSQKEDRFIALGVTNDKRKLIISFTVRNNKIRVISARNMSRKERKFYEKKQNTK